MENIKKVLEVAGKTMLSEFPDKQELTVLLLARIQDMLEEDFEAISRKNLKLKLVFSCVADVLEQAEVQQVKKKYATGVLDIFLDPQIVAYMRGKLGEAAGAYIGSITGARAELHCSQWSDVTSRHWQRAMDRFRRY